MPVIALGGVDFASRMGQSILRCVGLPELVAASDADYVTIAQTLAQDLPRLADLRATLRQRLLDSALCDEAGFTHKLELAYRQMWQCWCAQQIGNQPAVAANPIFQQALQAHQSGDLTAAQALYEQVLRLQPAHAQAWHYLGVVAHQGGHHAQAVARMTQAIALDGQQAVFYSNLGPALRALGQLDQAAEAYRHAIALAPSNFDAHNNLGNVCRQLGQFEQALVHYQCAAKLNPANPLVSFNMGGVLTEQGRADLALAHFEKALNLDPGYAQAWNDLGKAHRLLGRLVQAEHCFRQAIALNPRDAKALNNLAGVLKLHGQSAAALAAYQQALALDPGYADGFSNMLFAMQYAPQVSSRDLFEAHRTYAQRFEIPCLAQWPKHLNAREPNRRLKVGYVSADFRHHAVAYFIEPVLASHDKGAFEVVCYYNGTLVDAFTERIKAVADQWVPCQAMTDEQLAAHCGRSN
ncbi:MAG: tetratricopeptide repeat protein [Burkholderiales bacterium]|nr:tetratricopeptide repeat protein [Burkholderiales bacterium]